MHIKRGCRYFVPGGDQWTSGIWHTMSGLSWFGQSPAREYHMTRCPLHLSAALRGTNLSLAVRCLHHMFHQIYGVRYSTPCTQCHIQAFKPLSGSSLQATCGTISMQMLVDKLNHASSTSIQRHTGTPTGYFSLPDARLTMSIMILLDPFLL